MANVVGFTRRKEDGKYDIKLCTSQPALCEVQTGYYRFINDQPKDAFYPYPSSGDNINIFIPSRIVEDKVNFKNLVLDNIRKKQSCYKIDPCNIYVQNVCCKNAKMPEDDIIIPVQQESNDKTDEEKEGPVIFAILMIVFVSLILIGSIIVVSIMAMK